MAVNTEASFDGATRDDDYVMRMRALNAQQASPKTTYKAVDVEIEDGPADEKTRKRPLSTIKLTYALDQQFVFAVYRDHPTFHNRGRDEWSGCAINAIQKFASMRGFHVKAGPHPEPGAPYNMMAEFDRPLEMAPETQAVLEAQNAAIEKEKQRRALLKDLGLA